MRRADRIHRAERLIGAAPGRLFSCWSDPAMLVHWLPPEGMSGGVDHFDFRPGGGFRLVLSYEDPVIRGKSGDGSDVIAGVFTHVDPPRHLAFVSRFAGDDPAFAGEMRMDWHFLAEPGGISGRPESTLVRIVARNVPPGISAKDHIAGLGSSLAQLAALVE